MDSNIKVGIVDDHALVRNSISLFVNSLEGVKVCLEAENGAQLLEKLSSIHIHLILLDIQMPVMDGYETCRQLSKAFPDVKILIMSHLITKESIHKAMQAGAHGYFSKHGNANQLEVAIRTIYEKGVYFEPELGAIVREAIAWDKNDPEGDVLSQLSDRELLVIKMVGNGYNNAEIADKLSINIRTVESHRKRILDKTEAKNFTNVILMALKKNYISIEDLLSKS